MHEPFFGGNEKEYVLDCINSTFVSSIGSYVSKFEEELANYCNCGEAIAVVNGTSALHAALYAVDVKANDEVITQAFTFVATANAIKYCGANPIFVDVDIDTMGMSSSSLKIFLEKNAEIRNGKCINKNTGNKLAACIPMHTYGFPVNIEEICEICQNWGIPVIEDAAEALGSKYKGKALGTFGDLGVLSFNGNKIITSGGGGAILTNNPKYAQEIKHITTTAKVPHLYEFHHDQLGFNYRMPNLNAALLCAQLEQLDQFLVNKRELAELYKDYFDKIGVKFKWEKNHCEANFWLMCIQLESLEERNSFIEACISAGIMSRPSWQLMHTLPAFKDCIRDDQKNAKFLQERIVNIPSSYRSIN